MSAKKLAFHELLKRKYQQGGLSFLLYSLRQKAAKKTFQTLGSKHPSLVDFFFRPKYCFIELTNVCNLRCEMCYSRKRVKGFMEWQLYKKVVDEFATMRVPWVSLHYGGASLLHPNFQEMLEYAMEKHFKSIGWFDNGMLFSEEIADLTVKLGVDYITFSLEGLGQVNDNIRKGAKYQVIEQNILCLLKKRGKNKKPKINITMTDVGQGHDAIENCVAYWVPKVDYLTVSPCLNARFQVMKPKEYFKGKPTMQNKMCYSPFEYFAVLWNGDVVPCCHDFEGRLFMGNISDSNIRTVWRGYKYRELRKACATNNFPKRSICFTCNAWRANNMKYEL